VPIIVSHFQFFYQGNQVLKKVNKETLKASYRMNNDDDDYLDSYNKNSNNSFNNSYNDKSEYMKNKSNNSENTLNNNNTNKTFLKCLNINKIFNKNS
jgi:hypothetical protein